MNYLPGADILTLRSLIPSEVATARRFSLRLCDLACEFKNSAGITPAEGVHSLIDQSTDWPVAWREMVLNSPGPHRIGRAPATIRNEEKRLKEKAWREIVLNWPTGRINDHAVQVFIFQ